MAIQFEIRPFADSYMFFGIDGQTGPKCRHDLEARIRVQPCSLCLLGGPYRGIRLLAEEPPTESRRWLKWRSEC